MCRIEDSEWGVFQITKVAQKMTCVIEEIYCSFTIQDHVNKFISIKLLIQSKSTTDLGHQKAWIHLQALKYWNTVLYTQQITTRNP
jgi:hypothetical protein